MADNTFNWDAPVSDAEPFGDSPTGMAEEEERRWTGSINLPSDPQIVVTVTAKVMAPPDRPVIAKSAIVLLGDGLQGVIATIPLEPVVEPDRAERDTIPYLTAALESMRRQRDAALGRKPR